MGIVKSIAHPSHTDRSRARLFEAYRTARAVLVDAKACEVTLEKCEASLAEAAGRLIFGDADWNKAQAHLAVDTMRPLVGVA